MIQLGGVPILVITISALALMGCNSSNFALGTNERIGPPPPLGTPRSVKAVDGMIVGDRLMEAGEYELALASYKRAAGETGLTAAALSGMGSANLRLGRLNQAKILLDKALEVDDTDIAAWNNLGVVLMNFNQPRQAREAFRVAFGLNNGDSELIRGNLILANKLIDEQSAEIADLSDFTLVRHGNGSYFLLGN